MPFVRLIKTFPYTSESAPLVEIEVTFGENLPSKTVTLSKQQIDQALKVTGGKIEATQTVGCSRKTTFYFDYHIYPDNTSTCIISDEPFPANWWEHEIS